MPPAYRMLVADVDGTLMARNGHVAPRVREAVRVALAAGTLVVLATGRWFRSAQPIARELGLDLPIILHNGALVKDLVTGEVLDHCHLPRAMAEEAIGLIGAYGLQPMVYENAFEGERLLAGPAELDSPFTARYLATKTDHLRRVPLDQLRLTADPIQLAVADTAERADPLIADLARGPWQTVTSMTLAVPEARFVEVLSPGCSKAQAMARLAASHGVSLAEVVAVGDNYNDLDMLEAAGLGVAMGNAPEGVRARADVVVPPVEDDGLAVAIERYVLGGSARGRSSLGVAEGSRG
jgi:Cof subfamily protein (haloacid dehalogenase superfamily)